MERLQRQEEPELSHNEKIKMKKNKQKWGRNGISFSASLPSNVSEAFVDSFCMVKYAEDPFSDIRESILSMIRSVGVQDWRDLEELVYCYIVLNSSEVHEFIEEAFLSLCWS